MKFFYADSKDQSSLKFNFLTEEYANTPTVANQSIQIDLENPEQPLISRIRDPYVDDQYFHEVYDTVHQDDMGGYLATTEGYHGLLVSLHTHKDKYKRQNHLTLPDLLRFPNPQQKLEKKIEKGMGAPQKTILPSSDADKDAELLSILNANRTKQKKQKSSIQTNLPIIMDSGAFNYRMYDEPPYYTVDVIQEYERLRCTYGVALDHIPDNTLIEELKKNIVQIENEYAQKQKRLQKILGDGQLSLFESSIDMHKVDKLKEELLDLEHKQKQKPLELQQAIETRNYRWQLSIDNAQEFLQLSTKNRCSFTPMATAHGWDEESYFASAKALVEQGYQYIAVGGLVPIASNHAEMRKRVVSVARATNKQIPLHLFGIATVNPKDIEFFKELGVESFDSTSPLYQAIKDKTDNYWTSKGKYIAIRIPKVDASPAVDKPIKQGSLGRKEALDYERVCLQMMRSLQPGNSSLVTDIVSVISEYSEAYGKPLSDSVREGMFRTLTDQPWKDCPCAVCRHFGVEVILFRGTIRNKGRGFHNIWQLGQWVRMAN